MRSVRGPGLAGVIIAGLLGMTGCSATDLLIDREALIVDAGFRTDAESYRLANTDGGSAATIRVTLTNRFGTSLLPVPCTAESPEWTLERLEGDGWRTVAASVCQFAMWAPSPVAVGAEYQGVVRLMAPVQPGTYRLVFGILEVTGDATIPVLDGRARSNPFTLTNQ